MTTKYQSKRKKNIIIHLGASAEALTPGRSYAEPVKTFTSLGRDRRVVLCLYTRKGYYVFKLHAYMVPQSSKRGVAAEFFEEGDIAHIKTLLDEAHQYIASKYVQATQGYIDRNAEQVRALVGDDAEVERITKTVNRNALMNDLKKLKKEIG